MAGAVQIGFAKLATPKGGTVIVLTDKTLSLSETAATVAENFPATLKKAAKTAKYTGGVLKLLDILAPAGSGAERIVVIGMGESDKMEPHDWLRLGGAMGGAAGVAERVTIILDRCDGKPVEAQQAADVAQGILLRRYTFDTYKTNSDKDKDDKTGSKPVRITISTAGHTAASRAWKTEAAVVAGTNFARDLVNEPANVLGPVEFAKKLAALKDLGVKVETLDEKALKRNAMGALLGVAQGSVRPPRVVVMTWNGGKAKDRPVAFVGKGVVFDTGGISIKPAAGMGDMKGDMGGAAAVSGLMHAVAARKAKANIVGIVGLVENMPDGQAQRPGDIVTSMSGKTIEVLNTDAEGRLVLADLLTYIQAKTRPTHIIDLATLTGAVIIALGHHHAGMFSNNDDLCASLVAAGTQTGENVWRMPLGPKYDKLIESKTADMKNIGGRSAGSITAAQFIQRFIENDTPWAHLDIAGTAMGSPASETNKSWASGFGVRLLDRFVRDQCE